MKELIIKTISLLLNNSDTDTIFNLGWNASMPPTFMKDYPIYKIQGICVCVKDNTLYVFPPYVNEENIREIDETFSIHVDNDMDIIRLIFEINKEK